jgi:hypothetical protein
MRILLKHKIFQIFITFEQFHCGYTYVVLQNCQHILMHCFVRSQQVNLFFYVGVILLSLHKNTSEGANILGIFPFQAKSHAITCTALMRELASRGHNVTVLSLHPQKDSLANYTDIVLKSSMLHFMDNGKIDFYNCAGL